MANTFYSSQSMNCSLVLSISSAKNVEADTGKTNNPELDLKPEYVKFREVVRVISGRAGI